MRTRTLTLLLLVAGAVAAPVVSPRTAAAQAPRSDFQWGPAPAVFPAGAEMAVLDGNPGAAEPFTVRLRFPSGYKIAPHTHPTDEHVTVIQGVFAVGMGKSFEAASMKRLPAGAYVTAPENMAHFAEAHGTTIVQVHAMGPFALTYVDPADNPATRASR
jgi:quercetin dioxygenase-like cupin family protein